MLPVRRPTIWVVSIFLLGAAIGIAIIAVSRNSSSRRVVIKRVITTTSGQSAAPRASSAPNQPAANGALLAPDARASFARVAARLGAAVGVAVAPLGDGPVRTFGSLQQGHAWSTMKVPVLTTLLSDYEHSNKTLSPQGQADAKRALEESDNSAAQALFAELERIHGGLVGASSAVQQALASAGDTSTTINTAPNSQGFTTWGQSIWSNGGEVQFYRALANGCLLSPQNTSYVIGLMRNVTGSQQWGAGTAGYRSDTPLGFKAGWGPEGGGYLVRQTAIVGRGNHGYVISMITRAGSFGAGISMINALAKWARQNVNERASSKPIPCSNTQP